MGLRLSPFPILVFPTLSPRCGKCQGTGVPTDTKEGPESLFKEDVDEECWSVETDFIGGVPKRQEKKERGLKIFFLSIVFSFLFDSRLTDRTM